MKLKNIWHEVLTLFKPQGDPQSVTVEPGQTVEVPGELAADQPHPDAIVVEHPDGELMAYPRALWDHADAAPAAEAPSESVASPSVPADVRTAKNEG